jgi:uncharacterized RDD family membrane protein YckC
MSGTYGQTRRRNAAPFAGWWSRVTATVIDSIPFYVVAYVVVTRLGSVSETRYVLPSRLPSEAPTSVTRPTLDLPLTGYALIFGFYFLWLMYNSVYRQGRTGQSVGKTMLGIAVYRAGTIEPIGPGLAFARQFVHLVDSVACSLGYLWPLWDSQKRTFTDMIMSTRVYHASTLSRM